MRRNESRFGRHLRALRRSTKFGDARAALRVLPELKPAAGYLPELPKDVSRRQQILRILRNAFACRAAAGPSAAASDSAAGESLGCATLAALGRASAATRTADPASDAARAAAFGCATAGSTAGCSAITAPGDAACASVSKSLSPASSSERSRKRSGWHRCLLRDANRTARRGQGFREKA